MRSRSSLSCTPMPWRLRLTFLVLCLCVACTGRPDAGDVANGDLPTIWIVTGGWFDHLRYEDSALAKKLFLRPPSIIVGTYHRRSARVGGQTPRGFASSFAYASFDIFRGVARFPSAVRHLDAVMYDPEAWTATPLDEQRDPQGAFRRFASLSRRYIPTLIITPHPNLMTVPGSVCHAEGVETVYEAFIRCRVMAAAARSADIVEIQAQQLQGDPDAYRAFVVEATAQARAAEPSVRVIAGLTTANATSSQMLIGLAFGRRGRRWLLPVDTGEPRRADRTRLPAGDSFGCPDVGGG